MDIHRSSSKDETMTRDEKFIPLNSSYEDKAFSEVSSSSSESVGIIFLKKARGRSEELISKFSSFVIRSRCLVSRSLLQLSSIG